MHRPRSPEVGRRGPAPPRRLALPFVMILTALGCDDPYAIDWVAYPDTVLLYSLARPELNLLSAIDLIYGSLVQVEAPDATGNWDVALDSQDGDLVLRAAGSFGIEDGARIAVLPGVGFEDAFLAPSDSTLYSWLDPVPVRMGDLYVLRTRLSSDVYGSVCVYYAKLEPLIIDLELQALTFRYSVNPNCNQKRLEP